MHVTFIMDIEERSPFWISDSSSNLLLFKLITPIVPSPLKTKAQKIKQNQQRKTDLVRSFDDIWR